MSSAEAQASTSGGLADVIARLRASPRAALIIGVAAAVAVLAALLLWTRSPDYAVLYSGLANRDGGEKGFGVKSTHDFANRAKE